MSGRAKDVPRWCRYASVVRGDRLRTIVLLTAAAALCAATILEIGRRGPWLEWPTTIAAHMWVGPNDTHDVIILCKRAELAIPRGATVTVVRPSQAPHYEATYFLAAVGNLPHQRVVAPRLNDPNGPEYVIAVREPLLHRNYERLFEFPEGTLCIRRSSPN